AAAILCALPMPGRAATAAPQVEDLQRLSIEDLADLQVTSVSKRPEALRDTASSVYVITASDIQRSGATSITEVLRLAPNLEVARINGYAAAITARGFNSPETANKLLVLIDGRSVYEPIAGTVMWQQIDVALDNIDRIEVISGPGGTLWGANAVNGVINIITKDTSEAQGFYARATMGLYKRMGTVRLGGNIGRHASFRVYADGFEQSATQPVLATDTTDDGFRGQHGGFGIDIDRGASRYTIKGDGYVNKISDDGGRLKGYDVVGGWTRTLDNGSIVTVQAYFDRDIRDQPTLHENRSTFNFSVQQSIAFHDRHQFVWGVEARSWNENFVSFNQFQFADPKATISLGSLFAQDEISLRDDLKLTLGLKAEDNSYSGLDWLPNVRLAWQRSNNLMWASVSRAVRTPNRIERELEAPGILIPSPNFDAENLTAYEVGWRSQLSAKASLSLAAFYNNYDDLRTDGFPSTVFPIILQNGAKGTTSGVEGWMIYDVLPNWRLNAGFNLLNKHFELKPGFNDLTQLSVRGQDPRYQAQVRSEWTIHKVFDVDVSLRTVGKVDTAPVPAYTEAGLHLGWRVTNKVELALNGSNLLHKRHIEVWDPSTASPRYMGRSVVLSLRYGY
ncbi:MAG TPA: TonB-dependent receptor, partial [Asticcacaulis sp.]|nr:TonB-dependent receptor [Asticcacaulis sp.]